MKRFKNIFLFFKILLSGLTLVSCLDVSVQSPIQKLIIQVSMPHGFKDSLHYANQYITLRSNRIQYRVLTDSLGEAVFSNVIPDVYSVSTSMELTGDQYVAYSDTIVDQITNINLQIVVKCIFLYKCFYFFCRNLINYVINNMNKHNT